MPQILFEVPPTLLAACEIPEFMIENTAWLKLFVHPLEYKRKRNIEGGDPHEYTSAGVFTPVRLFTIDIELKVTYGMAEIMYLFEQLSLFSNTSANYRHVPLTMRDYLRPDFNDRGNYTTRKGSILSIEEESGLIMGGDGKYHHHGLSLVFRQLGKRHF